MTRPRPGIGSELLPVVMILLCVAGTWPLVVTMHHRGAAARAVRPAITPVQTPRIAPPGSVVAVPPASEPAPAVAEPLPPAPLDPTEQALARLMLAQTEQIMEAQFADRKTAALESARLAAVAEKERSKRREALIRTQVDALTEQAKRLEAELDQVVLERDVLAKERDSAKAALVKARARSSYAVLPHKGPNGTWRRPIIIECHNGEVTLQPNGPTFSLLELSMILGPRSAPIVAAVAREVVRSQAISSPDGAPVVPYIFFVIRPDGIKPYYNARAQLEPLGVSFGYELVDQNMEIDYPDLDNLDEWDSPVTPRPNRPGSGRSPSFANASADRPWPAAPARGAGGPGTGDSPDTFVWPARPGFEGSGSGGGSSSGYGTANGSRAETAGEGTPEPPRSGRAGVDAGSGSLARGPYPPARNGLGRGGSGVDLVPSGASVLHPDNPYDNPGAGGFTPGSSRSGGPPQLGLTSGSPGIPPPNRFGSGVPAESADGAGGGNGPSQPGGPRLVPISPGGMPGLENPKAAAGGSARKPNDSGGGSWIVADANQTPTAGAGAGTRPGGSGGGSQDLASLTPGAGAAPAAPTPAPADIANRPFNSGNYPASTDAGSFDATRPSTLTRPGSAGGSVDPDHGTQIAPPSGGTGASPQPTQPLVMRGGGGSIDPNPGVGAAQSVGDNIDPDQAQSPPQSLAQGLPPAPPVGGSGDPGSATMSSPPFGGNFSPNQGAPPPFSQLAQLAGTSGDPASGQPSTTKLQSSTGLSIPFPLPSQSTQSSSASSDSNSGDPSSSTSSSPKDVEPLRAPRLRSDLKKPITIDVPFEIVVACGPEGVVIHPGGYRLSSKALKGSENLLLRDLKSIVQTRRQVDPSIHPLPSIRFIVEPHGGETYRDARRQTVLSGMDWPVAIQVSDSDILDNLSPRGAY